MKPFLLLALLSSGTLFAASPPQPEFKPGDLLVKLESPARAGEVLAEIRKTVAVEDESEIGPEAPEWRRITLGKDVDLDDAEKRVRRLNGVAHVERNFLYRTSQVAAWDYVPAEKDFKKQWALFNFGQKIGPLGSQYPGRIGADIGILGAWNHKSGAQHAAKDVIVAVIDSGVTYDHADLKANIWHNRGETCGNRIDDDDNGYVDDCIGWDWTSWKTGGNPETYKGDGDPSDGIGHGTHVAGVIGAAHDGKGVAGINASVQIMPLKFIGDDGSGLTEFAAAAILYAVRNGADVINASWGGAGDSQLLRQVIRHANNQGVLFVAAAGNSAIDNDIFASYPANYPEVFSVISTDALDEVSKFSSFGRSRTIAAPGTDILSTYSPFLGILRNRYSTLSGTSMACPQVVGVAAMLIGLYPDKFKHDPDAIKTRIMESSDIQAHLLARTASGGRMNAYNAVAGITTAGHYPESGIPWNGKYSVSVESPHPYANSTELSWSVRHPGAKWIRLNIGRHNLERINDYVELRDADGALVDVITGFGLSSLSRPIKGGQVHLKLMSNGFVTGWGFEVLGYEVVE